MSSTEMDSVFAERRRELLRDFKLMNAHRAQFYHYGKSRLRIQKLKWDRMFLGHYSVMPPTWRVSLRRFGGKRSLPDFAVVPPLGCGIVDLSVDMLVHPNVMAPLVAEFSQIDPVYWPRMFPTERDKRRHAQRYGSALVPFFMRALHWSGAIYQLSRLRPGIKVIVPLREPARRLYSHWKLEHLAFQARVAALPFAATFSGYVESALDSYPDGLAFSALDPRLSGLGVSIYWKAVQDCIERFGAENVLALDMDEYARDRDNVLARAQEFVGLPRIRLPVFPDPVVEIPIDLPPADEESLGKLRTFFRPHNERLWNVLGRDFAW